MVLFASETGSTFDRSAPCYRTMLSCWRMGSGTSDYAKACTPVPEYSLKYLSGETFHVQRINANCLINVRLFYSNVFLSVIIYLLVRMMCIEVLQYNKYNTIVVNVTMVTGLNLNSKLI